jgi:arogenate dehydrogenase (NADP+)
MLKPTTVITDVGSVKAAIVQTATQHWPAFVGGHPMSGKSEAGLEAAEIGLFQDNSYVITPVEQTDKDAIARIEQLAAQLGSRIYHCTPAAHDRAVAWISHLPVMVSSNLIHAACDEPDSTVRALAEQFASSGFRDTSRVGGGNPELGLMMAQYNRDEVLRSLKRYRQSIDHTIQALETENWQDIGKQLHKTKRARERYV